MTDANTDATDGGGDGSFVSKCVSCGLELTMLDEYVGRKCECPTCGTKFIVERPTDAALNPADKPAELKSESAPPPAAEKKAAPAEKKPDPPAEVKKEAPAAEKKTEPEPEKKPAPPAAEKKAPAPEKKAEKKAEKKPEKKADKPAGKKAESKREKDPKKKIDVRRKAKAKAPPPKRIPVKMPTLELGPDDETPDSLMANFRGSSMVTIAVFTVVVHVVLIIGTSVPFLKRKIFGDNSKKSEDQRIEAAVKEATKAIREIAEDHDLNPQDVSSQFGGAPRAPKDSGKDPMADKPPVEEQAPPERVASAYETNLRTKAVGPTMPTVAEDDEDDDIFK